MADANQPAESFIGKFTVLFGAARELWLTFAVKLLSFAAYSITNYTLKLWLSSQFHYRDQRALGVVALWSVSMTVVTLLVGSLTDAIGLRRAFFLGIWACLVARAVMVFATTPWMALAFGLFPLAVGEALGTPVLVAAVRKYSTTKQRSISFSLAYTVMNVGSLAALYIFDWVRQGLGEHGQLALPWLGTTITTYRTLFLVSFIIELSMVPLVWLMRPGVEVTDEGVNIIQAAAKGSRGETSRFAVRHDPRHRHHHGRAFPRTLQGKRILPAARVPAVDFLLETDFHADVLRLSGIRHP